MSVLVRQFEATELYSGQKISSKTNVGLPTTQAAAESVKVASEQVTTAKLV